MARWLDEAFSGPVLFQAHLWSQHRRCTQVACVHPRGCGTQAMGYQQLCSLITPPKAVGGLPLWGLGPLLAEGLHHLFEWRGRTSTLPVRKRSVRETRKVTQEGGGHRQPLASGSPCRVPCAPLGSWTLGPLGPGGRSRAPTVHGVSP